MAVFQNLDWSRLDVWAIVSCEGLATIDERRHGSCLSWLQRHGYSIDSLDCRDGLATTVTKLSSLLSWEEQFGYSLNSDDRNLDRLRDGFSCLEASESDGGRVLELIRPDLAWQEDSCWLLGLLSIAQEHSRWELALGRRFFTLLVIPDNTSPLIGQVIAESQVSVPFWSPCSEVHEFIQ
jgi:hypothetical protein